MPEPSSHTLRLGTRGSMLAKAQSSWVARELERRNPGLRVELVIITTTGDAITDKPLHAFGGKGLFTKELELALLGGKVDFAVHSFKDVPVTMPLVDSAELIVAAVPPREDPRDCLAAATATTIDALPAGARVGTGSLRRRAQLLHRRPDLIVEPIRGNIDTRLRKLREGHHDAVILAMAGLKRGGLFDSATMAAIEPDAMLPAAGQGALALQCHRDNAVARHALATMHDAATALCVDAERAIVMALDGDCHSPIAAYATASVDGSLAIRAAVGGRDGVPPVVAAAATGPSASAVTKLIAALQAQNVWQLLHGAQ